MLRTYRQLRQSVNMFIAGELRSDRSSLRVVHEEKKLEWRTAGPPIYGQCHSRPQCNYLSHLALAFHSSLPKFPTYKARATRPAPVAGLQARLGNRGVGATSGPVVRGCPTGASDLPPVMSFEEVAEQAASTYYKKKTLCRLAKPFTKLLEGDNLCKHAREACAV